MAKVKKVSAASKKSSSAKKSSKKVAAPKKTTAKPVKVAKKSTSSSKKKNAVTTKKAASPVKKTKVAPKSGKAVKPVAEKKKILDQTSKKKLNTKNVKETKEKAIKPIVTKKAIAVSVTKEKVKSREVQPKAKDEKGNKNTITKGKNPKVEIVKSSAKIVEKQEDKLEPLQAKAQKVIKELEETMDLSKVRPRIQAGTTPSAPVRPTVRMKEPPLKLVEPTNTNKVKFQLEFEFRSSPKILFNCLSDSSGLAGWFADEVKIKDNVYTFVWEGGESYAKLVGLKDLHLVRFQWLDDTDGTYFQFEIKEDDITSDIALEITDFANQGDKETAMRLWESQVQKLRMLLGSL